MVSLFAAASAWESDPSKNDLVTPEGVNIYGYDIQTNCNGMTYVFFQTPRAGGITMRLQILDREGNKTLGDEGIIVSDEPNSSSTSVNQLMALDREGNAIIPVCDWRAGDRQALYTVYKVNEKGETIWSTTLNKGEVNGSLANMQVVQVADGGYVTACFRYGSGFNHITLEKLSADGESLWIRDIKNGNEPYTYPYLTDSGDGNVMLVYAVGNSYNLTARLIDAEGNDVWAEPLTFYTGGFSPIRAIHTAIRVKPAPEGGVLVAWMHIVGTYESRLAWIKNDGTMAFDSEDGSIVVSNATALSRYLPDIYYDEDSQCVYAIYRQFDQGHQDNQGLFMQKISPKGELLWGDEGKAAIDMQTESQYDYPQLQSAGDGRIAVFYQSLAGQSSSGPVGSYIKLYDTDGNEVQQAVNFSTSDDTKTTLATSPLLDGNHYLASWKVGTSSATSIYMQYVNTDGTTSAIEAVTSRSTDSQVVRQDYYNASGQRIIQPQRGLNIVRSTNGDNTGHSAKIIIK